MWGEARGITVGKDSKIIYKGATMMFIGYGEHESGSNVGPANHESYSDMRYDLAEVHGACTTNKIMSRADWRWMMNELSVLQRYGTED